jgi:hypothetical protein
MAKLLTEFLSFDKIEVLTEKIENSEEKTYKLKGPFLEAETKNKNGRIYSIDTLVREVKDFYETKILKKRSMGELDHPENPQINLERVSHIIEDLKMDGNTGIGVAKLIDTPMGRIAQTLVKEGVVVGMSTRGVGTLDGDRVKEDYKLITVDIVADPSAPNAFVEGVLENKNFIIGKDGEIVEEAIENLQKQVDQKYSGKDMSQLVLRYMMNFVREIRSKKN